MKEITPMTQLIMKQTCKLMLTGWMGNFGKYCKLKKKTTTKNTHLNKNL